MRDDPQFWNEKVRELTDAIECQPDKGEQARLYVARAHVYDMLGLRVESARDFLRALEFSSTQLERVHIKSMISLALLNSGEKEQAMWWATSAIDSDPDCAEGHYVFGLNCEYSELSACAVIAFRRTV